MSKFPALPFEVTPVVRDSCLCLHTQRAARALARRFDEALRPLDLTNGQFSLLMSLNRPAPPTLGSVAALLAMDRTTLTAALKPLERRGLVKVTVDKEDRRSRRLAITAAGRALLNKAFPIWKDTHAAVDRQLTELRPGQVARGVARVGVSAASLHCAALCRPRRDVVGEPRHGLRQALVGAVFLDDARALFAPTGKCRARSAACCRCRDPRKSASG